MSEIIPRTPEAEEEHQRFLQRCIADLDMLDGLSETEMEEFNFITHVSKCDVGNIPVLDWMQMLARRMELLAKIADHGFLGRKTRGGQ